MHSPPTIRVSRCSARLRILVFSALAWILTLVGAFRRISMQRHNHTQHVPRVNYSSFVCAVSAWFYVERHGVAPAFRSKQNDRSSVWSQSLSRVGKTRSDLKMNATTVPCVCWELGLFLDTTRAPTTAWTDIHVSCVNHGAHDSTSGVVHCTCNDAAASDGTAHSNVRDFVLRGTTWTRLRAAALWHVLELKKLLDSNDTCAATVFPIHFAREVLDYYMPLKDVELQESNNILLESFHVAGGHVAVAADGLPLCQIAAFVAALEQSAQPSPPEVSLDEALQAAGSCSPPSLTLQRQRPLLQQAAWWNATEALDASRSASVRAWQRLATHVPTRGSQRSDGAPPRRLTLSQSATQIQRALIAREVLYAMALWPSITPASGRPEFSDLQRKAKSILDGHRTSTQDADRPGSFAGLCGRHGRHVAAMGDASTNHGGAAPSLLCSPPPPDFPTLDWLTPEQMDALWRLVSTQLVEPARSMHLHVHHPEALSPHLHSAYAKYYYPHPSLSDLLLRADMHGFMTHLTPHATHGRPLSLLTAFNVMVDPHGTLYTRHQTFVREFETVAIGPHRSRNQERRGHSANRFQTAACSTPAGLEPATYQTSPRVRYVDEVLIIHHPIGGRNFYHWFVESFARAYAVAELLIANPSIHVFVDDDTCHAYYRYADGDTSSYQPATLELLGIAPHRIVCGHVFARIAYVPDDIQCSLPYPVSLHAGRHLFRAAVQARSQGTAHVGTNAPALREHTAASAAETSSSDRLPRRPRPIVILLKRSKSGSRQLLNHDEVLAELQGQAFDVTVLDDANLPPLAEILRMFTAADVIVGPHGAGFANILASRPGTCVIDLLPEAHPALFFLVMSSILELEYHSIVIPGGKLTPISANATEVALVAKHCAGHARRAAGAGA